MATPPRQLVLSSLDQDALSSTQSQWLESRGIMKYAGQRMIRSHIARHIRHLSHFNSSTVAHHLMTELYNMYLRVHIAAVFTLYIKLYVE